MYIVNRKTHKVLRSIVEDMIKPEDVVLECAYGTGLLSQVIAKKRRPLTTTDLSSKMLERAGKNCSAFDNITFSKADIMSLDCSDNSFDKVVAGNVIHLLDQPLKALGELHWVCRPGGKLIIPTYMNKDRKGKTSGFASTVGKADADFRRQFTADTYRHFFLDSGYDNVQNTVTDGRIPCAVAVMSKV